ncbi:glycerol transporter [Dimargaris xerosporica]|nr:glycerol transporter [Dimargaris xerosporica]
MATATRQDYHPAVPTEFPLKNKPPKPALWQTAEFYVYYVGFATVVPYMLYSAYRLSSPDLPIYQHYEEWLSPGWLFGKRPMDNSDIQYRGFRDHLPLLTLGMAAFVFVNRLASCHRLRRCLIRGPTAGPDSAGLAPSSSAPISPTSSLLHRVTWQLGCGTTGVIPKLLATLLLSLVFLYVVFGHSVIIILTLTGANYLLGRALGGIPYVAPIAVWVYNIGMLFLNETYRGYHFADFSPRLAFLDHNRGIMTRWDVFFNITMLRMVSFAMDYHWKRLAANTAANESSDSLADVPVTPTGQWHGHPTPLTEKERIGVSCASSDYNLVHYLAYLFYAPLYLAGPIITFNNFIWQQRFASPAVTTRGTVTYGLRLAGAIFVMECMQHLFYVVAISHAHAWTGYSPFQMSMIGYFNLKFIWLKLMIIWRYFRFWAMCDGLDVMENMRRCMSNNYSVQSFWRDWHCSFNRWLVRYVYIPLGGRRFSLYNVWAIFTFVAIWHDISLRLLAWAWLICLIFLPEGVCTFLFNRPKYTQKPWFRYFSGAGCVLNIFMMMVANLVGFSVGVDGIQTMLGQIFCLKGVVFIVATLVCLFIAVQIMFEIREHEYRQRYYAALAEWNAAHPAEESFRRSSSVPSQPAPGPEDVPLKPL